VVMCIAQVYNEFVKPIKGNHNLSLAYVGLMTCCFLSLKSRKHWSFFLLFAKDSCHSRRILLHFFFLLNKYNFLLENTGMHLLVLT